MTTKSPGDLVTTSVAARSLGIDPSTLTRWVHSGVVTPARRTAGGHFRWDLDDLARQMDEITGAPTTTPEEQLPADE
jgi:DNA-binding transcriptional MerR regulator